MFLKHIDSEDKIEVLDPKQLFDPFSKIVSGRRHAGEELQDTEPFDKKELGFLSGESLPACWTDPNYQSG